MKRLSLSPTTRRLRPGHWRPSTWPFLVITMLLLLGWERAEAQSTNGLAYAVTNGSVTITGFDCNSSIVAIPAVIAGLPVTGIGSNAFAQCQILATVTIPSSVTNIGDFAFAGCQNLAGVTIPISVASIGNNAFEDCANLTSLTIPGGVTRIGDLAFNFCESLTNLSIPSSVTNIGYGAFATCSSLESITVDALNPSYRSVDGILFDKSQTTVVQCPGGKGGSYAIPSSVTNIGDYAFSNCQGLTNLTIPSTVTSIGAYAFLGCFGMASFTIPASLTSIGDYVFSGCSLTSATIPSGVTSIGDYAFFGCSVVSVTIPSSVTNIGDSAFCQCPSLTNVTIPSSVISIGDSAFSNCSHLTGVNFLGNAPAGSAAFSSPATVFYLPGTTGWGSSLGEAPTAVWALANPVILTTAGQVAITANGFGFRIPWATNAAVVVEAAAALTPSSWSPLSTNLIRYSPDSANAFNGWSQFNDPEWTNYPSRFYRVRQQ